MNYICLRNNARISIEEHKILAKHFSLIKDNVHEISEILNGKLRAKFIDILINEFNGVSKLGTLKSKLDNDYLCEHKGSSPYYQHVD